ncbi:RNA dependent RNA polymerase-domain-containing protein [Pyrenochaeta sp. MPI-SDFR-AT-0127]|nr:RNA dependent RNA polymerase-domain-containing protein [Pyrenochaeta sp. MPI-SDFR-AT-0127]
MDIFIQNVPRDANHIELQIFLKDKLHRLDILAFEVRKFRGKNGRPFAILTVANPTRGNSFLQFHGSRGRQNPLEQLTFRGEALRCQLSNRPGQPEPLKVRTLQEKEEVMRAKMVKQGSTAQIPRSSQPTLSFQTLMTGVWDYDKMGQLVFDQKFKDERNGFVTFGNAALVLYLQQGIQKNFQWHCRVDIPYAILEHAIPSFDNGKRGAIIFTLKSPPKFYNIRSTDDLHLYAGKSEPQNAGILPDLAALTLGSKTKVNRLERLCSLERSNSQSSALCMVYRIVFTDIQTARYAWNFVKSFSVPDEHCWKAMATNAPTRTTESEYASVDQMLSNYHPAISLEFGFAVRFQLMALLLEGTITPLKMINFIPLVQAIAKEHGAERTSLGVRQLGQQIPTPAPQTDASRFELRTLLALLTDSIEHSKNQELTNQDLTRKKRKHHHLALTYKATVTPTGIILRGPDWVVSNRVLRKYSMHTEYFMRVFFADEDGMSVFHDPRASQEQVYDRFRSVLRSGISVAGRTFDFLGFSHASLRNHQAWFMARFQKDGGMVCATDIIQDLGDFSHIHCSAKCAARIGQAFSDTIFSIPVPSTAYVTETRNDVERNGRCFSDGCGTISLELLQKVWRALPPERREDRPTILQIRYRGAKGVLSLDKSLYGVQLHIRKSMTKYIAKESWRDLELCGAAYRPLTVFLNHQFIKILEDLGVPARNFMAVQEDAVNELKLITEHPLNAASFLVYSHSCVFAKVPRLFELMHQIGLSFHADRFLTDIVEVAAMSQLRSLKYRARIPIKDGFLLYGVMDETNTLKEGQVYIATQSYDTSGNRKRSILVGERIVVTRAPALHPGDIQLVTAVDVPEGSDLRALHNCIVFSQQGARDLPSQLSGGDLDGDLFHIIFDQRLIPDFTVAPADYESAPAKDLGRPVEVNDIVDFFVEYMNMDRLGQISNKHKIRADVKSTGTQDEECILLAKLASDAVDFSKSGNPADMSQIPRGSDFIRPDFMAPGSNLVINEVGAAELEELEQDDVDDPDGVSVLDADKARIRYYRSDKILGVLFRAINEKKFFDKMKSDFEAFRRTWGGESLIQKLERYIDREARGVQWDHHWDFAEQLREHYEDNMLEIMDTMRPHRGKPLTELEVFTGNILGKKERASSRYIREANLEVQERFNRDISGIIKRIVLGDGDWEGEEDTETLPRAIACYKVALEVEGWENYRSLKSWKYVAAAVCLEQLWKYQGANLRPL